MDVKDDLGNVYMLSGNGSVTDRTSGKFSSTMENLKEGATKLIITPRARVRKLGEPRIIEQEYKDNITGETKVENVETRDCIDSKQIEFEKIIVDIK